MRVLSVDIDFFVTPVAHDKKFSSQRRLSDRNFAVASDSEVEDILTRCGLAAGRLIPGAFIRDHVGAFDIIRSLATQHGAVDQIIHIDAHSDLGFGDPGWAYLLETVAHWPKPRRAQPRRGWKYLNLANWLPFVVANEWVDEIFFVPPKCPPLDLSPVFFREFPPPLNSRLEVLAACDSDFNVLANQGASADQRAALFNIRKVIASASFYVCDHHSATFDTPDYVIICQSPQFTPATADRVLGLCGDYVLPQTLPSGVRSPLEVYKK